MGLVEFTERARLCRAQFVREWCHAHVRDITTIRCLRRRGLARRRAISNQVRSRNAKHWVNREPGECPSPPKAIAVPFDLLDTGSPSNGHPGDEADFMLLDARKRFAGRGCRDAGLIEDFGDERDALFVSTALI